MTLRIDTPDFLEACFFMRNDTPDAADDTLPKISPKQVHGSEILCVNDENFAGYALPNRPDADGILLTTTRATASLRFADCAPVMVWGKNWVMILHSGYKGTVLNISGRGLGLVRKVLGSDALKGAGAWVGPCIGREHYCRDEAEEWTQRGMQRFHRENFCVKGGKVYFDLAGEIRSQLLEAGLCEGNIALSGIDTFTDPECCSYRRGDITERMTLAVSLSA
ncbi:MAG: polyphenol oxidase family protein [Synergistaceae bacterium]|nr:polyphenol oxidase family protein [Synergistaceae bacterium]